MGRYDFTRQPNRLQQHAAKWRASETETDLLQLWIADMDFLPLPEIRDSLLTYAQEHVFGYPYASDSLYDSILQWEKKHHGYETSRESIVLIEGVVPAISVAIQALTVEDDSVLINTPVYPPFARSVRLNHRKLVAHSLVEKNGHFEIDFARLEEDFQQHEVKVYIFCNPHNPGGRVWTRWELEKIGRLCQQYGVLLISDEIHQDLTLFGHQHCSFNTVDASFKEGSIVLASATKTFNIAGTKNSFAIIENPVLRKKFTRQQLANNQHEIPTVGLIATEAAYTYGEAWLEELKVVLEENITFVVDYLEQHSQIRVMKPEGTYLIWLDFSSYSLTNEELQTALRQKAKVVLNDGLSFGSEGRAHARLNAAAPLATIQEACRRIVSVFGN